MLIAKHPIHSVSPSLIAKRLKSCAREDRIPMWTGETESAEWHDQRGGVDGLRPRQPDCSADLLADLVEINMTIDFYDRPPGAR